MIKESSFNKFKICVNLSLEIPSINKDRHLFLLSPKYTKSLYFLRSIPIWYRDQQGGKAFLSHLPIDMIQGPLKKVNVLKYKK